MNQLLVDDRYHGAHGIGRYAAEVLSRLRLDWRSLSASRKPASALDAFATLHPREWFGELYSPGYAAFLRPGRQFVTIHDLIHLQTKSKNYPKYFAYYEAIVKPAVRRAGLVFTVSDTSAALIRRWLREDSTRIVNTGNSCSEAFQPLEHGTNLDQPYVLFVGNMRAHKNIGIAMSTISRMPEMKLRVLVPRHEVASAQRLAGQYGIATRVDVLHSLADSALAEQYRGAVATIMPSAIEGFGLPALESVRCGTPVIYWSGCPALQEASLGHGIAVDELGNTSEWAQAIEVAREHPDPRAPALTRSWDDVTRVVEETLRETILY